MPAEGADLQGPFGRPGAGRRDFGSFSPEAMERLQGRRGPTGAAPAPGLQEQSYGEAAPHGEAALYGRRVVFGGGARGHRPGPGGFMGPRNEAFRKALDAKLEAAGLLTPEAYAALDEQSLAALLAESGLALPAAEATS